MKALITLILLIVLPFAATAGVNHGGTLILHAPPYIEATDGTWCGRSGLTACEYARVDLPWAPDSTVAFYVIAAFPEAASPRLLGLNFGIDYDPDKFQIAGWETCGDFQLTTGNWPDPESGNTVTWNEAQTGHLTEVGCFLGYCYGSVSDATQFDLTAHPTLGGVFGDDSVPSVLDPITDYGRLGFGTGGRAPCPNGGSSGPGSYELFLRYYETPQDSAAIVAARDSAEVTLGNVLGGTWMVHYWDATTRTARMVGGSGATIASPISTDEQAIAAAFHVIGELPDVLGADSTALRVGDVRHRNAKRVVNFQQTSEGLDVVGGAVTVTITDQGRLTLLGSGFYPEVSMNAVPDVNAEEAKLIARWTLPPYDSGTDSVGAEPSLLILPEQTSVVSATYHLAWKVLVYTQSPLGVWVTWVDAHSGSVLARENDIKGLAFLGSARGRVARPSYCSEAHEEGMPRLYITVEGVGTTECDDFGDWSLPYGGEDAHTVTVDGLSSAHVRVLDWLPVNTTFSGTAIPGQPLDISFADIDSLRGEKNAYRAAEDAYHFLEQYLTPDELPLLDQQVEVTVNYPGPDCGARGDGGLSAFR